MKLVLVIIVAIITEVILSKRWNSLYFKYGILVFKKNYTITESDFHFPPACELNEAFDGGPTAPSLIFSEMGNGLMAIKDTPQRFIGRYPPILHASMEYVGTELTLRCFLSITLSVAVVGASVFVLPDYIRSVSLYGSMLVHLTFLAGFICLIGSAVVAGSAYSISRFKRAVLFCLELTLRDVDPEGRS